MSIGALERQSVAVMVNYDEWLNPGLKGDVRKRHAAKWLRDLGQGLWTACSREALGLKEETPDNTG